VLPAADPKIYVLRQRAGLFGANAPHPKPLSDQTLLHYGFDLNALTDWNFLISKQTVDLECELSVGDRAKLVGLVEARLPGALPRGRALSKPPGPTLRCQAKLHVSSSIPTNIWICSQAPVIAIRPFCAQSELLEIAEAPIEEPVTGAAIELECFPARIENQINSWRLPGPPQAARGEPSIDAVPDQLTLTALHLIVTPPLSNEFCAREFFA
jgi:hypothetical protein